MNKIILTKDGSQTVYSQKFDSTYHSLYGAIQESEHIFINAGLDYYTKTHNPESIDILEYGMGTGLNVLLTIQYAEKKGIHINYTTLEAYPLDSDTINILNYTGDDYKSKFSEIHLCPANKTIAISEFFHFTKVNTLFEDYVSQDKYDIIYFDAFDAGTQAHLWQRPFLDTVIDKMKPNSILVTYGAKGSFKRALKSLGLQVEGIQGPPGKREITRAVKEK